MKYITDKLISCLRDEDAATGVEYAVMLGLILMVIIGAIGSLGAQTDGMWGNIRSELRCVGFMK